jgi:hypothetical protein
MIITVGEYRELTGDYASTDSDVTAAIGRAQRRFEGDCERHFESAERTEAVYVGSMGAIPSAIPVTAVATAGATIGAAGLTVRGLATTGGTRWATLTYTGGYAPEAMPQEVKDAVAELAARYRTPAQTAGVPAGVTDVGIDSQSYSAGVLGGSASLTPALKLLVAKWSHPDVKPGGAGC